MYFIHIYNIVELKKEKEMWMKRKLIYCNTLKVKVTMECQDAVIQIMLS